MCRVFVSIHGAVDTSSSWGDAMPPRQIEGGDTAKRRLADDCEGAAT
jgi:hypothetical protein